MAVMLLVLWEYEKDQQKNEEKPVFLSSIFFYHTEKRVLLKENKVSRGLSGSWRQKLCNCEDILLSSEVREGHKI